MKALTALLLLMTTTAWATTPVAKQIDTIQNSTGGPAIAVGATGSSYATDSNTLTLTHKSIDGGTNTFTNIPVSAIATGTALAVNQGGTGATTLASNGIVQSNGTSPFTAIMCSTSGYVLTWGGSSWACAALPATAPTVNGTAAAPQSVTAAGGISLSAPTYQNVVFIKASTSGTTTVTATPSITACTAAGQRLTIISESSTNLVTLQNNGDLSGSNLYLNGPWTSGENNGTPYQLELICDGAATPFWAEANRNN